jgi:hypothetical protein
MSLLGRGVVVIWHGLQDAAHSDFYAWHNSEHMPERAAIRGFLRGRRYHDGQHPPELLTLYETLDTDVLTSRDYLERLNAPTPWTVASVRAFTNLSRALAEVRFSQSTGDGAVLRVFRFDVADAQAASVGERLVQRLQAISRIDGVVGVHLCATQRAASAIASVEKKDQVLLAPAGWALLIEFGADLQGLAADHPMHADLLGAAAGITDLRSNLFHLQYQVLGVELTRAVAAPGQGR